MSSIHFHRRNRSFPSNEQFIDNRSHLVPTSTRRYVNSFARALRVFPSPMTSTCTFLNFFFSISNRSHHRCRRDTQLKSGLLCEDSQRQGRRRLQDVSQHCLPSPQKSNLETGVMFTGLTNLTHIYVSNTQTQQIRTRGGFLSHDKQYNGKKQFKERRS